MSWPKSFAIAIVIVAGIFLFSSYFDEPIERQTSALVATTTISVVAENLEIPWDIAFLPEGGTLVTERPGRLVAIGSDGTKQNIPIQEIRQTGEGGLLGIVLHPDFSSNRLLYLYMTAPAENNQTQNRVVRYRYENNSLTKDRDIISGIPGAIYHDGGRMEFGPDGMLYITTGDATNENIAQDKNSLGGKILRVRDDGSIPKDNPFNTAVYSYGHRNPQGLAWDDSGKLWETEHGRSGLQSGLDEINQIVAGENYGWPTIEGNEKKTALQSPILHSGNDTWAPASLVYLDGSLYFGGLRGEALYEAVLSDGKISELKTHFKKELGRIRTLRLGPDHMLYITTSNRDGRGNSRDKDDKILRVNPKLLLNRG